MAEIFISYRRGDSAADWLHEFLNRELYAGAAFLDNRDLGPGVVVPARTPSAGVSARRILHFAALRSKMTEGASSI